MRCCRVELFHATKAPLLFLSAIWSGKGKGKASAAELREKAQFAAQVIGDATTGLGTLGTGRSLNPDGTVFTDDLSKSSPDVNEGALSPLGKKFQPGSGVAPGSAGSTVPKQPIDEVLLSRPERLTGPSRLPLTYELDAQQRARERNERQRVVDAAYAAQYDENNMPRHPEDPARPLADWEFHPDADHKALVLLLYRNILKGLVNFKSIRRRSLIAYARMAFRRRSTATEKLLVDECIEEARRALYVLGKHHQFTVTREYEFDSMSLPKDTGQDVKTYMEEHYDPEISRMQFQNFTDVQPGKEHLHRQNLSPTSGQNHWRDQKNAANYRPEIKEEDKVFRPPPPPGMG